VKSFEFIKTLNPFYLSFYTIEKRAINKDA